MRNHNLLRNYGITTEKFEEILALQGGKCLLGPENCKGKFVVDHKGKNIRGILCTKHNMILGFYEQNKIISEKLENYIAGKLSEFIPIETELAVCKWEGCSEIGIATGFCHMHYKHNFGMSRYEKAKIKLNAFNSLKSLLK